MSRTSDSFRIAAALTGLSLVTACDGPAEPIEIDDSAPALATEEAEDVVTTSASAFTEALEEVDNENELIIWVKGVSDPRANPTLLEEYAAGRSTVAVPFEERQATRNTLHVADNVSREEVAKVVTSLDSLGVSPYWVGSVLPVLAVQLPTGQAALDVVQSLLVHENVDWIEPNLRRPAKPAAGPTGNNPTDAKHDVHFVQGAWDHTRGLGAKIGVLDSGFAGDIPSWTFHPDGGGDATFGVWKLGFVDDGGSCNSSQQAAGQCLPFDDNRHGTYMTGLVGANDNNLAENDWVGIAPYALTYSMKIAFNADRPGLTCGTFGWGDDRFCIESEDLIAGVDWASANGIDVLSMSFTADLTVSEVAAISYAYNTYDVLLLGALGNDSGDSDDVVSLAWVMGVGGVASDLQRTQSQNLQYWEIGGYSGGGTTAASCPDLEAFCEIGTYANFAAGPGGTSSATANVAAVAALLRAYSPSLTNVQARDRLKNTAYGRVFKIADAEWAIENVTPVAVGISGPGLIESAGIYSWIASASNGLGSYTYYWEYRLTGGSWQFGGTSSQLTLAVGETWPDFEVRATVDSFGRKAWRIHEVDVNISGGGGEEVEGAGSGTSGTTGW